MKFLKIEKGIYNYINRKKVVEILKTILMFAAAIGLYLIGYITLKTNKNLFTIFAVLSVLPAAKSAVSMIMFLRFTSINSEEYDQINEATGKAITKYEYVFTTSEKAYYVKSVSIFNNTIIALYDKRKTDFSKELKEHLTSSMDREGIKGYSLKIYTDIDEYVSRLTEMNEKLNAENDSLAVSVFALFNAISI